MRGAPIKHPRKIGEHIARLLDFLADNGATNVRVWKTKHVVIVFRVGTHELEVRAACTPRDETHAAHRLMAALRREVERVSGLR